MQITQKANGGTPMTTELKVLVFVDQANVHGQEGAVGRRADLVRLTKYLAKGDEGRRLVDAYVYAPLPHENGDRVQRWHDFLRHSGLQVVSKRAKKLPDGRVKADMDMYMAMDALELGMTIRPDVIVLVTGDGDMAPLALRLRRLGIRVEVASGTQALAAELKAASHGVVNLDDFFADCDPVNGDAEQIGSANILGRV
jgi:uncharacterized LabA/DUF88 family protein